MDDLEAQFAIFLLSKAASQSKMISDAKYQRIKKGIHGNFEDSTRDDAGSKDKAKFKHWMSKKGEWSLINQPNLKVNDAVFLQENNSSDVSNFVCSFLKLE